MNKLKILYFIIIVELLILGVSVFVEKNEFHSKKNNYVENNINEDKIKNKSKYNEVEKNKKFNNTQSNQDEALKEIENKILNRDEIKESIENKFSNDEEKLSLDEIENILKDEAISVFKVDCSNIKGSLNFQDNKNILSVALKVDKNMFNTIKELLYHENQEYGVLKALLLLRDNLDEKDFEKVRETAGKYVDMDKVEEYYYLEKSGASLQ